MKRQYRSLEDYQVERFKDKKKALSYLAAALQEYEKDYDNEAFLIALRNVAKAQGGIAKLAEETQLNRESLYRTLSVQGNPRFNTVDRILNGLGFRLNISPL